MTNTTKNTVIVGAGPAGISAAIALAKHNCQVTLIDEQPQLGGQIYRNIDNAKNDHKLLAILGKDYSEGSELTALALDLINSKKITYLSNAQVWYIQSHKSSPFSINYSQDSIAKTINADYLVLATGAQERPTPMPGWQLPGVMTAGAQQILLKTSGVAATDAVICGSGPLIYLVAVQLINAGTPPKAIIETQQSPTLSLFWKNKQQLFTGRHYLYKGLSMLSKIRKAGISVYKNASDISIDGGEYAQSISFTSKGRREQIDSRNIFLHQGVVPNIQISQALELEHNWDDKLCCFYPLTDENQMSSQENIYIAGDGQGIIGAKASQYQGQLVGLNIAHRQGVVEKNNYLNQQTEIGKKIQKETAIRDFLNEMYQPNKSTLLPQGETIVCRCEEVAANKIKDCTNLGCEDLTQLKAYTRCGMGPCQGRYCGLTANQLISKSSGQTPTEIDYFHIRFPIKPITVKELAEAED